MSRDSVSLAEAIGASLACAGIVALRFAHSSADDDREHDLELDDGETITLLLDEDGTYR